MEYAVDVSKKKGKEWIFCKIKTGETGTLPNKRNIIEKWLKDIESSEFYLVEGGRDWVMQVGFMSLARKLGHRCFLLPLPQFEKFKATFLLEKQLKEEGRLN